MIVRPLGFGFTVLVLAALLIGILPGVQAQPKPASARPATPPDLLPHGTPRGWKLVWPKGDPAKGREVFTKLECYSCHEVRGERFPAPTDTGKVGPELAQMGPVHPAEYFAEAIINPSAVIEKGKGYQAPDGTSKMPSYNDSVTVQEVIDLVAYLRQLRPAPGAPAGQGHGGHSNP